MSGFRFRKALVGTGWAGLLACCTCRITHPVQLRSGLRWGDQMETGDKSEWRLNCLQERDGREVGCGRTCMGEPPPHQLEETSMLDRRGTYRWRQPGTCSWHLQRSTLTRTEDWSSHTAGAHHLTRSRKEGARIFDLQWRASLVVALMMTEAFSWNVNKIVFPVLSWYQRRTLLSEYDVVPWFEGVKAQNN